MVIDFLACSLYTVPNSGDLEKSPMSNHVENNSTSVFAYLRTSSAANVKGDSNPDADSDTRQRLAIERYAASYGMAIAAEFYDAAVSGADPIETRKGFADMIGRCAADGVKVILVESAHRFARDVVVQELGLRVLASVGVSVIPVDAPAYFQDDPNNPTQTLIRQILGAVSGWDKQMTVIKLREARKRKRVPNLATGKRTLTGEGKCEGRHNLSVLAPDAVLRAKELRGQGMSLRDVAEQLEGEGFVTRKGTRYRANAISNMLSL
jgi:DNA invertase Pin-like site-specific DNA recombinase